MMSPIYSFVIRVCLCLSLAVPLAAQSGGRVNMELDHLEKKADQVVRVNLEGESLDEGRKLLWLRQGISAPVKELVKGIKGIYLSTFRFGRDKAYDEGDVDSIHQQMKQPGWVPMIDVSDRTKPETVTVYSYMENEAVQGVTVVSSEPKEVTVVNIVGPVDLETLMQLGGQMGIPVMNVATRDLKKPSAPLPAPADPPKK